jgi:pyruvate,orthophosphate dikinase
MRQLIVAKDSRIVRSALERLLGFQREDFVGLFRAMDGFPVTIRLLDPPLHEFLPETDDSQKRLANSIGLPLEEVHDRIVDLHEMNPMLGYRGCRIGICRPEINRMQVRAIVEAAAIVNREGINVRPEIMVPFISSEAEMRTVRKEIKTVVAEIREREGFDLPVLIGTMIEIPRAAISAGRIALHADFFSFGTNDLTQMTFGISRDDAEKRFLPKYVELGLLEDNPFSTLDVEGVGALMRRAMREGRKANPRLKVGLCGEHGGDPRSIAFCEEIGLDYVSCSPFRVPIARLASARYVSQEESE